MEQYFEERANELREPQDGIFENDPPILHRYNLRKRKLPTFEQQQHHRDHAVDETVYKNYSAVIDDISEHSGNNNTTSRISFHFIGIVIISFLTRLWEINASPLVVWDEAHFGKFANWYLKRTFYFDVHPPLGKMLIALFGHIHGYNGSFSFDSGKEYDDTVPIKAMRTWCAIFGAFVAPLVYGTCRNMRMSKWWAFTVASMVVFDNALLSISKFVLLDPILLCFTAASMYGITSFETFASRPFSRKWHKWLMFTGISLGCVMSVKWVGLFTYATVGLFTIRQLWDGLPLVRGNLSSYGRHWFYRAIYLIVVPVAIYMATFYAHFTVLQRSGPGDSHMSSFFQSRLINSPIKTGPELIVIGESTVSIRNHGHGGGLLHSHPHAYPVGSKQAQITLYHHRDGNNQWRVFPMRNMTDLTGAHLQHGDIIRLFHNSTGRNLHSHSIAAPISVYENEVSGYGNSTFGDDKDYWIVEVVDSVDSMIHRLSSTFRLKHQNIGCYLSSTGSRLPEWGYEQMEVVCSRDIDARRSLWNIEEHTDGKERIERVTTASVIDIKTNEQDDDEGDDEIILDDELQQHPLPPYGLMEFLQDFYDLNVAMWYGNNALTPKLGKKDILISKPAQWPFLQVGLRMCNWNDETRKFYLLGNPMVWWICTGAVFAFPVYMAIIFMQKKITGFMSWDDEQFVTKGILWLSSWILHYTPFLMMGRVTYLHHYFPALIMSTMLFGHVVTRMVRTRSDVVAGLCFTVICATFVFFSPFSYGFIGNAGEMASRQWRSTWNIL